MTTPRDEVSGIRFMFTAACLIQGSSLLAVFLLDINRRDSWVVAIAGAVLSALLLLAYGGLVTSFPGKNLVQILTSVFGGVFGTVLALMYVWFFITLASLNLRDMASLVQASLLDETPTVVIAAVCLLVSAWAAKYGLSAVARYGPMFAYLAGIITVVSIIVVASQMNLRNLIPPFDSSAGQYAQGLNAIVTIPFGELVALLMITSNVRAPTNQVANRLLGGLAIGAVTLIVMVMRNIAVLGDTITLFTLPSLVTLRLASVGRDLARAEILFATAFVPLLFFKVMVFLYIAAKALAETFRLDSYRHLVLALGALMIVYGMTLYPNPLEQSRAARDEVPIIWTFFEVLVPVVTLVVAKARGFPRDTNQNGGTSPESKSKKNAPSRDVATKSDRQ